jgi:F-type H+-transporting ATPase subunit alpha
MEGLFDGLSEEEIAEIMVRLRRAAADSLDKLAERIEGNEPLSDDDRARMLELGRTVRDRWKESAHGSDA